MKTVAVEDTTLTAEDLARRKNLSTPEAARLFALLNFAQADSAISCTSGAINAWKLCPV